MKNLLKEIKREQKMAEHLFFVSLKYTKSGDVILNLVQKWEKIAELCIDLLLQKAKKKKEIKSIPTAPKLKENLVRSLYPEQKEIFDLYVFFRRIPSLEKIKEHEFRKNVMVRILDDGKEIEINMEKLKKWYQLFDEFVKFCERVNASKK
ncbi:MAG: hypothetical protein NZ889_01305 [Candidatus Pacearchaeota archaeon]|nr:hypothetical protein [Candidatus Pacearchaeota archaeon]